MKKENDILETTLSIAANGYSESIEINETRSIYAPTKRMRSMPVIKAINEL